jgi:hypothetical protein
MTNTSNRRISAAAVTMIAKTPQKDNFKTGSPFQNKPCKGSLSVYPTLYACQVFHFKMFHFKKFSLQNPACYNPHKVPVISNEQS